MKLILKNLDGTGKYRAFYISRTSLFYSTFVLFFIISNGIFHEDLFSALLTNEKPAVL